MEELYRFLKTTMKEIPNERFKVRMCSDVEKETPENCNFGTKCHFAHVKDEIRTVR